MKKIIFHIKLKRINIGYNIKFSDLIFKFELKKIRQEIIR